MNETNRTRMEALATEAHLTLALMHAQGVVYHLADQENRSLPHALAHGAAAIFSGASFVRHLREKGTPEVDGLAEYYERRGR